ncbi:PTS glucose transporter subunit IIA [Alkalihalobacillus alcalophilus ATCC 27647 = CGMCC 1.3604]|uniref:Glucose transporter n=1 Tax=Alkalihalobacillus alcalophilus ATCC 27647 = CGMCC 1.3604 TaxID=1218173 RepID=J8TNT5_ALKAL|nr:PTS glucose transporter subunit IIA [Alkalihalobacillus alcalophilus]AFV25876.1 glucose transporter [Alkalihalobacillus alcalophilus ATCC 27647 = CGMCC 1.3604]KGA97104.1 PTS glucose transporter subunit IIA [Alkalihalobacillus alcalophilus ATCC 27647 = CGMCC 1.3604]MED1563075.1 PTS glucose transporter subunit IIA [Alkalihalobacillus alcalophilus]THG89846.1 PTS glucose transporter subunit IIA [Alkalihalobacillus alcalophilus ATCC 27647 = CGMCC 1.3604]
MLKKLFGLDKKENKKNNESKKAMNVEIFAPLSGAYVKIEDVPDPTFSQKMMGDGIAIEPSDGQVVSPVKGSIVQVFPTKHAVGIKTDEGVEVLIHIGLETVKMNGEGFTAHVKEGDAVEVGDALIDFDLKLVTEKANSTLTPIVITNQEDLKSVQTISTTQVEAGNTKVITIEV